MLRTVWFFVVMVASTIWYGTSVLVAGLMGVPRRDGGVYDRAAKRWARNALWAAGIPYRVVGVDHVPLGGPFVVASNHQSWFDIFLLAAVLPGSLRFVAKKELASVPLLGRAMRQGGPGFSHWAQPHRRGGVPRGPPQPHRRAPPVQEGAVRAGDRGPRPAGTRVLRRDLHLDAQGIAAHQRSEEHTSELQSRLHL